MTRETQSSERVPGVTESRAHPRFKIRSLAYVEFGDGNAGLILNISETGMAVQAVQMLSSTTLPRMQFRLPKTESLIEVSGKVIWQVRSKKEAGIEFSGLSDQARQTIRSWIAAEESRLNSAGAAATSSPAKRSTDPPIPRPARDEFPSEKSISPASFSSPTSRPPKERSPIETRKRALGVKDAAPQERNGEPAPGSPASPPSSAATPSVPSHWRAAPKSQDTLEDEPETSLRERAVLERAPSMPRWNGYMAPGVGMEFKKSRRWWSYTAALGLIAAIAFAAIMLVNPDIFTRARINALTNRYGATPNDNSQAVNPDDQNPTQPNATNANPANGNPPNANANPTVPPPSTEPSSTQPRPPSGTGASGSNSQPNTPANAPSSNVSGSRNSSAVPPATSNPAGRNSAPVTGGGYQSRSTQQATRSANEQNSYRPRQTPPGRSASSTRSAQSRNNQYAYNRPSGAVRSTYSGTSSRTPSTTTSSNQPQPSAAVPARNNVSQPPATANRPAYSSPPPQRANPNSRQPAQTYQNRQQSNSSSAAQTPLQTFQNQTQTSSARPSLPSGNQVQSQQPPANRVQDAYARSAPSERSTSRPAVNSSRGASAQPEIAVVEIPSYQSTPVPPSMPLAGVPSGSVAANSQFHAIHLPPNLAWTRSQLPTNLQIGSLVSSYSPAYPIEAAREGIEGTVRMQVTVNSDGTVRGVRVLSGPAMLSSAAVSAVRDWRYAETFLAGQTVETEQYVTMFFRLASAR